MRAVINKARVPAVAITTGDPCGIGTQIALRAATDPTVRRICRPAIVGNKMLVEQAANQFDIALRDTLLIDVGDDAVVSTEPNSAIGGQYVIDSLRVAVDLVRSGRVNALATAPASKTGLHAAGLNRGVGQTALIRQFAGVQDTVMLLTHEDIRTAHLTDHVPLSEVSSLITATRVRKVLWTTACALRRMGIEHPRIAVAGLNPHAGEGGVLGWEEQNAMLPGLKWAQAQGISVVGPFPTETIWPRAHEFDVIIVAYHDAGHVPMRMLAGNRGLHLTLGLGFPRVAPLHGCAFGHVERGTADHTAMREAVLRAARMCQRVSEVWA